MQGRPAGRDEQVAVALQGRPGSLDVLPQSRVRATLAAPHKAGVADNVGGQDRRQFLLLTGQWNFPAFLQRLLEGPKLLGN